MFTIDKKAKNLSMALMAIGLIALIFGFISNPHGAWPALLFNTYFYLGISVFAVFFVALQYVAEAGWSIVLKRVPEAIMGALPVFSGIMLLIMIASIMHWNHIYHWLHDGIMDPSSEHYDRIIAGKEPYLNATFFIIRTIVYLLGWNYFAKKLRSLSLLEDKQGGSGKENIIEVSKEEMYNMNSNVFSISEKVIISEKVFTRLNMELRKRGFIVEEVPYAEIAKMSGLFRCSTMPLMRW